MCFQATNLTNIQQTTGLVKEAEQVAALIHFIIKFWVIDGFEAFILPNPGRVEKEQTDSIQDHVKPK